MRAGRLDLAESVAVTQGILAALSSVRTRDALLDLMRAIAFDLGFRHFALIHHADLREPVPGRVNIKDYPPAITERIIDQGSWRRDPVVRGSLFADGAFLWSNISALIQLDRRDREALAYGASLGLNEGITVPFTLLGRCPGSCTFAGMRHPRRAERLLGIAQMVGIFAFQAARRIEGDVPTPAPPPRLHPRPRDCVALAGRGCSNKQIARALGLAPRTVDGYLTVARRLFGARDRTELVISAILAGEVSLDELR